MRNPLRLAFEVREGVGAKSKPAHSRFRRGEGHSMRNPLRLAFEAREGVGSEKGPHAAATTVAAPVCYDPASSLHKRNDVQGKGWLDFNLLDLTDGVAWANAEDDVSRTGTGGSKG